MTKAAIDLTIRNPAFDMENAEFIWARTPEFAVIWNAMGTGATSSEPYLNRVMMRARKKIGATDKLYRDIAEFVGQESNHCRMHERFNKRMEALGYGMFREEEERLNADYRRILDKKSFAFNLAYCAGFENFTLFSAKFMYEEAQDMFEGANMESADLILWHLAEEFEHRSLCHEVFARLSGNYFMRAYGVIYSYIHLNTHLGRVVKNFLAQYRAGMSDAERKASIKREKAYTRRFMLYFLPRALLILLPFYDPGKARMPENLRKSLDRYKAMTV